MQKLRRSRNRGRPTSSILIAALLTVWVAANLAGQSFPSGSTNFATINVAAASTLKLSAAAFPGPIYFPATGAVTIAGTIDLSGQNGLTPATSAQRTTGPIVPGAGGYGGGLAGFGAQSPLPGQGPSGGTVAGGCYGDSGGGGFSGNQFLAPLVGGSGGAGFSTGSGGALGGAGTGGGGGIRLVAPSTAGNGMITAAGGGPSGYEGCNGGVSGIVRLESYQYSFTGTRGGTFYTATPINLFLPAANVQPSIMVTSIGGIAVPANPTGTFTVPDVALNSSAPLTVSIKASNIPPGTIPTVYFITENFPNHTNAASAGLAGTPASSTASAAVTLNPGYTGGYVAANWTQ